MAKKIEKLKKKDEKGNLTKSKFKAVGKVKAKKNKVGFFRRVANFLRELKSELKKVVWPSKKNVVNATFVVIVAVLVMTAFVVFADFLFRSILKMLLRSL